MTYFTPDNIESLTVSAISAAAYLDACDAVSYTHLTLPTSDLV